MKQSLCHALSEALARECRTAAEQLAAHQRQPGRYKGRFEENSVKN
jgi:hypothetical protein